jgi:glutamate synthase (NADPH/NADH) small chain
MPMPPETRDSGNPWPQWPRILRASSSHEEGGERRWSVTASSFLSADNCPERVGAAHCSQVEWKNEDGRFCPVPLAHSDFVLPADMVLLAMGFTGVCPGPLLENVGVEPAPSGRLPRDDLGRLPGRGLYVCGDAALGPSLVVRAIHDGLHVARTVLEDHGLSALVPCGFA